MKKFSGNEDFEQALKTSEYFLLLKHSSTCPISQAAYDEYEKFSSEFDNTYYLVVQEERSLSNHVAEKLQIKHESPQAIIFKHGEAVWHASHWKITYDSLKKAVTENN